MVVVVYDKPYNKPTRSLARSIPTYLPTYLSTYLPIYLFIYLSIYLSIIAYFTYLLYIYKYCLITHSFTHSLASADLPACASFPTAGARATACCYNSAHPAKTQPQPLSLFLPRLTIRRKPHNLLPTPLQTWPSLKAPPP